MKKLNLLGLIIFFLIGNVLIGHSDIQREGGYPPEGYCSAKSTLKIIWEAINNVDMGADCEVHCPAGQTPSCHGYFFSCSCECLSGPNTPNIVMPHSLSNDDIKIANDFTTFCNQSQSSSIQQLGALVNSAKEAILQSNTTLYTSSELQFDQIFDQLGSLDIQAIETWINNYAQNWNNH
jgi:hypothetical protein